MEIICLADRPLPYTCFLQQSVQRSRLGVSASVLQIDTSNISPAATRLVENYLHLSTNPAPFELFCILRWFALLKYVQQNDLPFVAHVDGDVLFSPEASYGDLFDDTPAVSLCVAFNPDYPDLASGHVSVWAAERLEAFCEYMLSTYVNSNARRDLEAQYLSAYAGRNRRGGVSDMTLLRSFWDQQPLRRNLLLPVGGRACGHNINTSESADSRRYAMRGGMQRIKFDDNGGFVVALGQDPVRLWALHFQGRSKCLMRLFGHDPRLWDFVRFGGEHLIYNIARSARMRLGWR